MKVSTLFNGGAKVYSYLRKPGPNIHSDTLVGLTTAGRQRAEDETEAGIKYDILISLSQGEKRVGELARDIGESTEDVKTELKRMRGLVRFQDTE